MSKKKTDPNAGTLGFVGAGNASAGLDRGHSNMYIDKGGETFNIDLGSSFQFLWGPEMGRTMAAIKNLWISHAHADHIGSMEWLMMGTYFNPTLSKPNLYMANADQMKALWENSLKGGAETLQGKVAHLTDYFNCHPVGKHNTFEWQGLKFQPVQTVHVMSGYEIEYCYGLMVTNPFRVGKGDSGYKTFITTDTQFKPDQLIDFIKEADQTFHDMENVSEDFKSGVHAHKSEVITYPEDLKESMYVYHCAKTEDMKKHGFAGMVEKGDTFSI